MWYTGISVLEPNLFQKAVEEAICSKTESPLSSERSMTDHTGISMKGLLGQEPKFCSITETLRYFSRKLGWEPNCLRWEMFENQGSTVVFSPIKKDNNCIYLTEQLQWLNKWMSSKYLAEYLGHINLSINGGRLLIFNALDTCGLHISFYSPASYSLFILIYGQYFPFKKFFIKS